MVQRATIADQEGAYVVLNDVMQHDPALQNMWADHEYTGNLIPVVS